VCSEPAETHGAALAGLIAASGRVSDIDMEATGVANFEFCFLIIWLLLKRR